MKKTLLLFLLILMVPTTASAVVDPDVNKMSIYFDLNADEYELWAAPATAVPFHVILTNPDFDALYGYEFGFDVDGGAVVMTVTLHGDGTIDVGGGTPGNHIVGLAAPLATTEATLLATVQVFMVDYNAVLLTLTAAQPSSVDTNTPAALLANDVIEPIWTSAWDPSEGAPAVCAWINYEPFAVEEATWDQVKTIYR